MNILLHAVTGNLKQNRQASGRVKCEPAADLKTYVCYNVEDINAQKYAKQPPLLVKMRSLRPGYTTAISRRLRHLAGKWMKLFVGLLLEISAINYW